MLVHALFVAFLIVHVPQDPPSPPASADLDGMPATIQRLYQRLAASTVVLRSMDDKIHHGSGVIIDADGLVLTHGHHGLAPGGAVVAKLADGRSSTGKYLGVDEFFDQSLIRLDGDGPWPEVSLGSLASLRPGDPCILLGYPKVYYRDGRQPLLRFGRVIGIAENHVFTSVRTLGGDSGGPLFDAKGELLGTHQLQDFAMRGSGQVRIDVFRMLRAKLLAGEHVRRDDNSSPCGPQLAEAGNRVRPAVVTVLVGDRTVGLGTIVDAAGWIVTKGSELGEPLSCRLSDGRQLPATVAGKDHEHDLAVLRVRAEGLAAATWADGDVEVGRMLVSVTGDEPLQASVVGSPILDVPAEIGELALNVMPAAAGIAGVAVAELWRGKAKTAQVIEVGDVITHVDGKPTPDPKAFFAARQFDGKPRGVVGSTVEVTIVRRGETLRVDAPIESRANIQIEEYLGRRTGFPAVFVHDGPVHRNRLGGPVVDGDGKVSGVNIATEPESLTYALPARIVLQVVQRLRRE